MAKNEDKNSKAPQTLEEALLVIGEQGSTINAHLSKISEQEEKLTIQKITLEELETLKADLEKKIDDLLLTIESKDNQISSLQSDVDEATALVEEINGKLSLQEEKPTKVNLNPVIEINGDSYEITSGIQHEGVKYSALDLSENEDLVLEVLDIEGQTIVVPVTKK